VTVAPSAAPSQGASGARVAAGTFLGLLSERERQALDALGVPRRFPTGALLMFEQEPGDRVMILLAGRIKVTRIEHDGHEVLLSIRDPGDVIGELSCLDGEARIASVTALEPVEALVIATPAFRAHLESVPRVAVVLFSVVIKRFRDTTIKLMQFAASDTTGRLAARLVELADRYGSERQGRIEIDPALSQEELAAWTGASRAGVAKALQTLRELGWIETQRRRIVVVELDQLRARAA
jgi:CRP/FNR family transcriptional regulator, cyclic AMP receptor protein